MRSPSARSASWAAAIAWVTWSAAALAGTPPSSATVCIRAAPIARAARSPDTRLSNRIAALGGRMSRGLLDGLPTEVGATVDTRPPTAPPELDPRRVWLVEAPDPATAARLVAALSSDRDVEWVEPNAVREATLPSDASGLDELPPGFPSDPLFRDGRQWGLDNRGAAGAYGGVAGADIGALRAWEMSCGSPSLRLAVADTGVDPEHPDLQQRLADGPRLEAGLNVSDDPSGSSADSAGHGTLVAGVMAARTHNPTLDSLGVAGVCGGDGISNPGCRILPIKISRGRERTATSFDLARAILYAVAAGARAVNVSFAGGGPSRLERLALTYAIERGCLVVAASGNRGSTTPRAPQYPAAYAADGVCLQVGASDPSDRRAPFSSFGPGLDLVAPGVSVWTTAMTYLDPGGAPYSPYAAVSGTSLAAPFATGAAGLLAALRPELAADDLRELLRLGARDVGAPGPDEETGMGALDAAASLRLVSAELGIWHDEVAADSSSETGADTLRVAEPGPGSLSEPRAWPGATRIEFRATVTLPDSFADSVRVWPRVAGTTTMRGDFELPYYTPHAEVVQVAPRSFTLRGYGYRVVGPDGEPLDLPLPADQMRFGFTVIGRVRREPPAVPPPGDARGQPGRTLAVAPNPFRLRLHIERPAGASLSVIDLAGRRVRAWPADDSVGAIEWDGRDAAGLGCPPGLYWVRSRGPGGISQARVIKLE